MQSKHFSKKYTILLPSIREESSVNAIVIVKMYVPHAAIIIPNELCYPFLIVSFNMPSWIMLGLSQLQYTGIDLNMQYLLVLVFIIYCTLVHRKNCL